MTATTAKKTTPAQAAKKEAQAKPEEANISFEYEGETYEIDRAAFTDLELIEAVEDEHFVQATRGYLGKEQWSKFKNTIRGEDGRVPVEKLEPFLQKLMDVLAGNA